MNVIQETRRAH